MQWAGLISQALASREDFTLVQQQLLSACYVQGIA